jgi:mobilome CxxCx(11)CxxC protein
MSPEETAKKTCLDKAFAAYGTTKIFESRAQKLSRGRTLITYLGIVVPLVVGATAMAFGVDSPWFPVLVALAAALGIAQIVTSVWAIVARWDERCIHALESVRANTKLFNLWSRLELSGSSQLEKEIADALKIDQEQEDKDLAHGITEQEKRYAMHEALFYFRKPCVACRRIPTSKEPLDCDMCGNY